MSDLLAEIRHMAEVVRDAPPIGTIDNPYVVFIPQWFVIACEAEGITAQQVYD